MNATLQTDLELMKTAYWEDGIERIEGVFGPRCLRQFAGARDRSDAVYIAK